MPAMQLFSIAQIPVRATMGYALFVMFSAYSMSHGGLPLIAAWVLGVTLSVIIHEFGHALVARHFKLAPHIELHFWGGLCYHAHARKNSHDVAIVASGPLLQIAVGFLVWLVAKAYPPSGLFLYFFVEFFVYVSVIWGALNLFVPIWPLDGGQLFRMLMLRLVKPPAKAERIVHVVSIATAAVVVVLAFAVFKLMFVGALAIMWIFENIRAYQGGNPVPIRLRSELADKLLAEAKVAGLAGEWHEARRLAFQARDEKTVTDDQLTRIFELITVASAELGDWHEALAWAPRAPRTQATLAAKVKALSGLGKRDQARAELEASDAPRLDPAAREALMALVEGRGPS